MSAPGKSEVGGSLNNTIKDKNSENMKSIHADCNMDFELQAMVMATIQGHTMANINTATGSLLEAIAKEDEAKAQRIKALKEAKPADLDHPPEGALRRGQFYYRKWGHGFCSELMYFSEPLLRDIPRTSPGVRTRTAEYVEYAWDVKIVGPTGDMIFTDQKADQFQRMIQIFFLPPIIVFARWGGCDCVEGLPGHGKHIACRWWSMWGGQFSMCHSQSI